MCVCVCVLLNWLQLHCSIIGRDNIGGPEATTMKDTGKMSFDMVCGCGYKEGPS